MVVVALAVGLGLSLPNAAVEVTDDFFNAVLAACDSSDRIEADLIPNGAMTKAVELTSHIDNILSWNRTLDETTNLTHVENILSCRPENLALWWLVGDDDTYAPVNKLERFALATLYLALGGSIWKRKNGWLSHTSATCEWESVTCDDDSLVVISLDLDDNNLVGNLPTQLVLLTNLDKLVLANNEIGGTLPTELGMLTSLQYLVLTGNYFSGELPSELGLLTELVVFVVHDCKLFGQLPSEFGKLTRLKDFEFSSNFLEGTIPSQLFLLTKLTFLGISLNSFRSTLPSEIGSLSKLTFFESYETKVSGTIPTELGLCTALTKIVLDGNDLTGLLPTELANLVHLEKLFLYKNRLVGTVPDALCALPTIRNIITSYICYSDGPAVAMDGNDLVCPDECCTSICV